MALELCLESSGWIAQFAHANSWDSVSTLVRSSTRGRRNGSGSTSAISPTTRAPSALRLGVEKIGNDPLDETVRCVAAGLPYELTQALWLVDGCGLSYAEAATEATTDRDTMAGRVARGRTIIRDQVFPLSS